MTRTQKAYFAAAKAVSKLSDHKQPLGAVVVLKHRIISSGCNSNVKCNPLQAKLDTERYGIECPGKCHAEIDALLPLIKNKIDLSNASIYIFRQHKNGEPAIARPCEGCERVIRSLGIKKVFYTIENGFAKERWQ